MSYSQRKNFLIPATGTHSAGVRCPGYRLVGLILPTLTSTKIQFEVSPDGSVWTDVYDRDSDTPAAVNLGAADTGGKAVAVPDEIGKLSVVAEIRLEVSAQASARTIVGLWERVAG